MGKIKSKQVKRAASEMMSQGIDFSESFEKNKKILGREMPSKKMRNKIAGYLSRYKKQKNKEKRELEISLEK
jgi:ribosomal protein S17E